MTYYWQIVEKNSAGQTAGPVWSFTASCTGVISELTNDCIVDFADFARLADAWMGNPPAVDLNNDSILDFSDIAQLSGDWLR